MKSCCESKSGELAELRASQGRVLKILLALNAGMFFVEFTAAWWLGSTALLGDSLDMFGDASVYALTLYVLHRSMRERAMSALIKGIVMLALGLIVLGEAGHQALYGVAPAAHGMGVFALLALIVNLVCFGLLWRFKSDDLNMRSTWLCSRNDIMANVAVFVAAILVGWTGSRWPDVLLGAAIAALFLQSSWQVIRDARVELREAAKISSQAANVATQTEASDGSAPAIEPASSDCCASTPQKAQTSDGATPRETESPRSAQVDPHESSTTSSCCSAGKTCRDD